MENPATRVAWPEAVWLYVGRGLLVAYPRIVGRAAMVGGDAGTIAVPGAIRPVRKALPGAAQKRPGRATSARAPASVGVAPPTHSNLAAHAGGTILAEVVSS